MRTATGQFTGEYQRKISAEIRDSYRLSPKLCAECGCELPFEKRSNKYCCMSCAAISRNTGRNTSDKGTFTCKCCGSEAVDARYSGDRVFCSLACQAEFKTQDNYSRWISGESAPVSARALRRLITIRDGYSCRDCGISDWNGKHITLEVEHISGDSDDNSPDNLCLLCPNCHSQTDTFKGKNLGKGRHSRRQRYGAGLSY